MATNNRRTVQSDQSPWKWVALSIGSMAAVAMVAGAITSTYHTSTSPPAATAPAPKRAAAPAPRAVAGDAPLRAAPPAVARPSAADIEECNRAATASQGSRTRDALTGAVVGGAAGAALGAAGGAIADGGSGAGKGAGIGGLVGATAGTLYGLNKSNSSNADSAQAYRVCMERKGF